MQSTAFMKFLNNTWKKVEQSLKNKGFKTAVLDSEKAIRNYIYENIPDNSIVGLSSSISSGALKIKEILLEKGNKVYNFWNGNGYNRDLDTFEELPEPDYFITKTESITSDCKVLNAEFSKNKLDKKEYPAHIIAITDAQDIQNNSSTLKQDEALLSFNEIANSSDITVAVTSYEKAS